MTVRSGRRLEGDGERESDETEGGKSKACLCSTDGTIGG